jgi:hypothetical protein
VPGLDWLAYSWTGRPLEVCVVVAVGALPVAGLAIIPGSCVKNVLGVWPPELSAYAEPNPRVSVAVAARIMVFMVSLLVLVWPFDGLLP